MGIVLTNVSKHYLLDKTEKEKVLQSLTLTLESGKFISIYGPSGCGKTTLLNIIGGLDSDYEGTVLVDGVNLSLLNENQLAMYRQKKIGFIFQNFNLVPHKSVLENVLLPMYLNNNTYKQNVEIAQEILARCGMEKYQNKYPPQLSGGQKQRVAIARALANGADIIIADEPTGSLDSKSHTSILKLLKELSHVYDKTILVVTHNEDVLKYSDIYVQMKDGKIVETNIKDATKDSEGQKEDATSFSNNNLGIKNCLKLGWMNFKQRRGRNLLVALSTSIGLLGILLSLGIGGGIQDELKKSFEEGKIPAQVQITKKRINDADSPYFTEKDFVEINNIKDKYAIRYFETPFSVSLSEVVVGDSQPVNVENQYFGQISSLYSSSEIHVDANDAEKLVAGEVYSNVNERGITINTDFIKHYNLVNGTQRQAEDFLNIPIKLKVQNLFNEEMEDKWIETQIVRVIDEESIPFYMSIADLNANITNLSIPKVVSNVIVDLNDYNDNNNFIQEIIDTERFEAFSEQDIMQMIVMFIKIIQGLLIFMSLQAILIAMVMLGIVLYISVIERTKEIGVMKAVGFRNANVKKIFIAEALIIGFEAFCFAFVFSILLGLLINQIVWTLQPNMFTVFLMRPSVIIGVLLFTMIISIIAALYPIRRVAKLDPAVALRYE